MKYNYDTEEIIEAIDAILKTKKDVSFEKKINLTSNNKLLPETEKIISEAEKFIKKF